MVASLKWTEEMRTVLMLLRKKTAYNDDSDKVSAVFNHIFATEIHDAGYTDGMPPKRVLDAWNGRNHKGRSSAWRTVGNPPRDEKARRFRQELMSKINTTARELGLDDGDDDMREGEEGTLDEGDGYEVKEEKESGKGEEPPDTGEDDVHPSIETADDATAEDARTSASPATDRPLEMIHGFANSTQHNGYHVILSSTGKFIDHDRPIYQLGGRVYRIQMKGDIQDVMVCNKDRCKTCKKRKVVEDQLHKSSSETQGLPFVHARDLQVITHVGFRFNPKPTPYNNNYPKDMWKNRIMFADGVEREVMVCLAANCEHCSGKEAVEKRAARYLPGGDLYELKKKIEQDSSR